MKQVILMRTDLGMSVGKMCAQAAHAAGGYETPRVVLKVNSDKELNALIEKAREKKLHTRQIFDAGHTEVPVGTFTCAAIGPGQDEVIDKITGQLPLL